MSDKDGSLGVTEKKQWKRKLEINRNFDNDYLQQLQRLVLNIDLINEGVSNDYKPFIAFIQKGYLTQVVQAWSYYAQINNSTMFGEHSMKLAKALAVLNSDPTVQTYGSEVIKNILSNYSKVLYRGLSNMKPSVTNPMLKMMREMVVFNNGQHVEEFLSYFNLSTSSVQKILKPNKTELSSPVLVTKSPHLSMRANFIKFWVALVRNTPILLRKDLLIDNHSITSSWFKYMAKVDRYELIEDAITLMKDCVLREKSFRKSTKCKILNEAIIGKLQELYYYSNKKLVQSVDAFFQMYGSDPEFGIGFCDEKLWFDEPIAKHQSNYGVVVTVNQKSFKIYNKLLYSMLTFFRPWEDDLQCNTVIKVLNHVPELVPPYCNYLATLGYHDPKMTSYWFGLTLLLGRIINLPIPPELHEVQTEQTPNNSLVLQNIIPCSMSSASLIKCFQHEVPLIKHLGCQLLIFSLKKFEKVLNIYTEKGWESDKASLNNLYQSLLPEVSIISSTLNEAYIKHQDNKLLFLSLTTILKYYSSLFPNNFQVVLPANNVYVEIMKEGVFKGLQLVILDNFLQFQELNSYQIKWWQNSENKRSLFSSLLQVAASNQSSSTITTKISNVLDRLLKYTLLFNKDTLLASPVLSLINSCYAVCAYTEHNDAAQIDKIWKLLDEATLRCVKFPYKYIDMSAEYGYISPFIVALCEQWKYVDKKTSFDIVSKWILIFLRSMAMIGESSENIFKVLASLDDIDSSLLNVYFPKDYEKNITTISKDQYILSSNMEYAFVDLIALLPVNKISNVVRLPVNDLDACGLLFRIQCLLQSDTIEFEKDRLATVFDVLFTKCANYAASNSEFREKFMSEVCFKKFVIHPEINTSDINLVKKYTFTTKILTDIYGSFGDNIAQFQLYGKELILSKFKAWQSNKTVKDMLVNVFNILPSGDLLKLIEDDIVLDPASIVSVLLNIAKAKSNISGNMFLKLLEYDEEEIVELLGYFADLRLIEDADLDAVFEKSVNNFKLFPIIERCIGYPEAVKSLQKYLDCVKLDDLVIAIGALLKPMEDDTISAFCKKALKLALEKFDTFKGSLMRHTIYLFSNCQTLLAEEDKNRIVEYFTTRYENKYSVPVATLLKPYISKEVDSTKMWLNKCMLFITKKFAELDNLPKSFTDFLSQFKDILKLNNTWSMINKSALNAELEVILGGKWVEDPAVLEYANILVLGGLKSSIESSRLLQIFIHNREQPLAKDASNSYVQYLAATICFNLFNHDIAVNSNVVVQETLLRFYNGTVRPSDRILLNILEVLESKLAVSWTNEIYSWEFLDNLSTTERELIGSVKLLVRKNAGFVVTLSRDMITDTIRNYPFVNEIPEYSKLTVEEFSTIQKNFFDKYETAKLGYERDVYDPLFILLLVLHNGELVKFISDEESGKSGCRLDVKKLLDSKLAQLAIMGLSDSRELVAKVSFTIINQMLISLNENYQFKDSNIFKILFTKIVYTFAQKDKGDENLLQKTPPIFWFSVSRIVELLLQPRSLLYESAYRWVLSSPSLYTNNIALFQKVMPKKAEDIESYYLHLQWVLETILSGMCTEKDVNLLKSQNILEWLLNLQNSPYLNLKLQTLINLIVYKLQRTALGGSMLVTRFSGLAYLESVKYNAGKSSQQLNESLQNNPMNRNYLKDQLISRQTSLNSRELTLGCAVLVNSKKRLLEWTSDDLNNIVKRIRQ
ncbi:HDR178Wp [Eremothecium sinecaudum]|uniref:HDR178Wp n=1 Tax=Eremothecium sinecaudum TaxID=45286 RepID=A0A0X8HSZ8_9SACH|nr:HDR178Wp [Eremothecium sinecaudum]AMD20920.1 HDR178Wp [Eremothecium sinecaudum]